MNSKKYFLIFVLAAIIFLIVFSVASTIIDDTQSEFDNGTYINMYYNTSTGGVELITNDSVQELPNNQGNEIASGIPGGINKGGSI